MPELDYEVKQGRHRINAWCAHGARDKDACVSVCAVCVCKCRAHFWAGGKEREVASRRGAGGWAPGEGRHPFAVSQIAYLRPCCLTNDHADHTSGGDRACQRSPVYRYMELLAAFLSCESEKSFLAIVSYFVP